MRSVLLILTTLFAYFSLLSQEKVLPIWTTETEKALIPSYKASILEKEITNPPVGSEIRTPGQWEEVQAVCITWTGFPSIHRQ